MTQESDAARLLGMRGGRAKTKRKADASATNARRWQAQAADTIERIREVGRQYGDLALAENARLWRRRCWRADLARRVYSHNPDWGRILLASQGLVVCARCGRIETVGQSYARSYAGVCAECYLGKRSRASEQAQPDPDTR